MVGETVEECRRHLGIAEHAGPFADPQGDGDEDTGLLVEPGEQMEQERPARETEGQVAELVEDDEIEARQPVSQLPCLVQSLFLLEGVDQIDGGEEPDLPAMMLDSLDVEQRSRGWEVAMGRDAELVASCDVVVIGLQRVVRVES